MFKNKSIVTVVLISIISLLLMTFIEKYIHPQYWIKSMFKLIIFLLPIIFYSIKNKISFKELIYLNNNKPSKGLIIFMLIAYLGIIILYLLLRNYIDLENIKNNLFMKENLNKSNFIFIFTYIIIVNSFIEESFFRGFIYKVFKDNGYEKQGIIYSSILFALYHISIMDAWFNPMIMGLAIVGLFFVGLLFHYICIKEDNLLGSWLVHGFGNLAINTIGTIMLFT